MATKLDYTTEATLESLFSDSYVYDLTRYLGLDPLVDLIDQPINVRELLHDCVQHMEQWQFRSILQKTVTMTLPYEAFCDADNQLFLPYGNMTTLATATYVDTDGTSQDWQASTDYSLLTNNPPCKLWANNWDTVFPTIDRDLPEPITLTYVAGYASFSAVPRSTRSALQLMCKYHYDQRGTARDMPVPPSVRQWTYIDALDVKRCEKWL